ncbi:MAG TPA: amino acid racemase [Allosphingosinicella sp.]|nr:amino acid racemase [Allosphingosinicella sp.]
MRKLGLIGGMSWVSTAIYYEAINKGVAKRVGGLASAPLLIESLDFATVEKLQAAGEWDVLAELLIASAKRLEKAGAEGLMLCSNTAHKMHDWIDGAIKIPMIHIGDVTAARLTADGIARAGLIGTRFTMSESFYRDRLEAHGIAVSVPDAAMAKEIDRIIFEELARGHVSRVSQRTLKTCITMMAQAKSQAVILGCTELVMLVDPGANVLPVYDTTALHSKAAVEWILEGEAKQEQRELAAAAG